MQQNPCPNKPLKTLTKTVSLAASSSLTLFLPVPQNHPPLCEKTQPMEPQAWRTSTSPLIGGRLMVVWEEMGVEVLMIRVFNVI